MGGEILGPGVAQGHRGVLGAPGQQQAERAADGALGFAGSALWLLILAVFWPQLSAYYHCMGRANTVAAQQACRNQFTSSVDGEISFLRYGR